MSSADLLHCMPQQSVETASEIQPPGTSSTGLPSSPSVSVSSTDSPSQTSPSSACGSSSSERRINHEHEENESGSHPPDESSSNRHSVNALAIPGENDQSSFTGSLSNVTSNSASPIRLDSLSGNPAAYLQHNPQFYNNQKSYQLASGQQQQRLVQQNATRPRRLRLERGPVPHRVGRPVGAVNSNRTPNCDMPMFNPVALDFSPSSNSSSPLTGYGVPIPMQPYPIIPGLVYPQPLHLLVGEGEGIIAAENNSVIHGNGSVENGNVSNGGAPVSAAGKDENGASESSTNDGNLMAPHVVQVHVNPGVIFNVRVGDDVHQIQGPATVPMVSPTGPPHPLPLQVPPGHVVQQVIDEHGTLRHVILSLQQGPPPMFAPGSMDGTEYIPASTTAPITSTSSPSQVNGGGGTVAASSGGSSGSRTNTPPSPSQPSQPRPGSSQLSVTSATFQPSAQAMAHQPSPYIYHPMPPPFIMSPLTMPPGPPMQGYSAVSPIAAQVPMPGLDGSQYSSTNSSSAPSSARGSYYHPVPTNFRNPQSQDQDDSSVEETQHQQQQQQQVYDLSQQSPVIIMHGDVGQPILLPGFELSGIHNGVYSSLDQFNAAQPNIPPGKATHNYGQQRGSGRPWRKQPSNQNLQGRNMPDRLRRPDGGDFSHEMVMDDSSSSSSSRHPSSPPRPRFNDQAMTNGGSKKLNGKVPSLDAGHSGENGNNLNGDQPHVEASETINEPSEEEIERRKLIEAIEAALSQLGPPRLINVTATSLTVEMAPLPIDQLVTATGLTDPAEVDLAKQNIAYDVSLSVPLRENQYDNIYTGQAAEVNVVDLKPATHYSLGVAAVYTGPPVASPNSQIRGATLPLLNFQTGPSHPEKPDPPKLANRTAVKANSMQLRWNQPSENGAPITSYLLEWKRGKSLNDPNMSVQNSFSELFRCDAEVKNYRLTNLMPATLYSFRLAAFNALGQSPYSDEVSFRTSGAPPPAPEPPQLQRAGVLDLTLSWPANVGGAVSSSPLEFILQMDDLISGHGYLTVYKGADVTEYTVGNLRRNSEYRFRLAAENDDGTSKWSEPAVTYRTLPDVPRPPVRVTIKSAAPKAATSLSAHSIRLVWDAPRDDGGAPIESYEAQAFEAIDNQDLQPIHVSTGGAEREVLIENLHPGRAYRCRVRAKGVGGFSEWSDFVIAGTAATCPGICASIPTLQGRVKPTSIALKWSPPASDGGAAISSYEVRASKMTNSKLSSPALLSQSDLEEFQTVYEGAESSCIVHNLAPGRSYAFQVRALNRVGTGPWNPSLPSVNPIAFFTTAAAPPDAPTAPVLSTTSPYVVALSWQEPASNGAKITEYRLEKSQDATLSPFIVVYSGSLLNCEVKSLQPATQYSFRLQAVNIAGSSPYSPVVSCQTPSAPPAAPTEIATHALSANSVSVEWLPPGDHGSPIVAYNISLSPGDRLISVPVLPPASPSPKPTTPTNLSAHQDDEEEMEDVVEVEEHHEVDHSMETSPYLEYIIEDLEPDTVYRLRVQALNALGTGAFSNAVKVSTPPLPPQPPEIELAEASHNLLRVRWAAIPPAATVAPGTDLVEYTVLMDKPNAPRLQPVYTGTALSFTAKRLQERTSYRFAIQVKTQSGGVGPQSAQPKVFSTLPAPPQCPTGLVVGDPENETLKALTVSWKPLTSAYYPVEYVLQCATPLSPSSFVQLYRGSESSFTLLPSNLTAGTGSYSLRVAAVYTLNGEEFVLSKSQMGAFSPAVSFRINKVSSDEFQLLPANADVTSQKIEKSVALAATATKSSAEASSARSASSSPFADLLVRLHLRRSSDDEAFTDTQLAVGFIGIITFLAVVVAYVANAFLSGGSAASIGASSSSSASPSQL